jgi:ATP-dependent DNA ligase
LRCKKSIEKRNPEEWEIKYDGYRLRLERDGDRVRLITKGGYNWSASQAYARMCRFPSARQPSWISQSI